MLIKDYAPIALFVYKRPEHTGRVLDYLSRCRGVSKSTLFVFSDGAKKPEDIILVEQTREVVKNIRWDGRVHMIESPVNKGLANSIISGVTSLVNEYGRVIVLEDDLLVAPHFLEYMNLSLECYTLEDKVLQISGHMFPVEIAAKEDAVFMPLTTSWGWATWKRAWGLFDAEASGYEILLKDKMLRKCFNLNGSYPYTEMLIRQMEGKVDSWAIRWYWSFFKAGGLCLYPKVSLVYNIGMDGSGTHCGHLASKNELPMLDLNFNEKKYVLPAEIEADIVALKHVSNYLKKLNRTGIFARIANLLH